MRHSVLAICEFLIALGLAFIAVNAGYAPGTAFALIVPVVAVGFVRSFRPRWLTPDLAYADMMILSLMTAYVAVVEGNLANAISRGFVLFGLCRLAALRVQSEKRRSLFDFGRI